MIIMSPADHHHDEHIMICGEKFSRSSRASVGPGKRSFVEVVVCGRCMMWYIISILHSITLGHFLEAQEREKGRRGERAVGLWVS